MDTMNMNIFSTDNQTEDAYLYSFEDHQKSCAYETN